MGASLSWLVVSGREPDAVLGSLGLARTGESREFPRGFCCASLPDGWFVVVLGGFDSPMLSAPRLQAMSAGCRVLSCQVEEHVMVSEARLHAEGQEVWSVIHDAQEDIYHLDIRGHLPADFAALHARYRADQDAEGGENADVDMIFDVPLALAKALTGFRHDEPPAGTPLVYEILQATDGAFDVDDDASPDDRVAGSAAQPSRPWWQFW